MSIEKNGLIQKFGLSEEELDLYGIDFLIQYLKYHKQNKIGVFFLGFDKHELVEVKNIASLSNLLIVNDFSNDIDVFCIKEGFKYDIKKYEIKDSTVVISESEFVEIFKIEKDYLINKNGNIYPYSVKEELRIVKPLSNFDVVRKIQSYSDNNRIEYNVNLYKGTCTCKDYVLSNRGQYVNGDLRRYCKHLKDLYKSSFFPRELKCITKYFLKEKFYLRQNIDKINITAINKTIYVAYNTGGADCDFYFPIENDSFKNYGYNYETKYFYDRPHGYATVLRKELDNYFRSKRKFYIEREKSKKIKANLKQEKENFENFTGCLIFVIIIFSILYSLF